MADIGTFTAYPALEGLPPLVRKQRTLEAKIQPLAPLVEDEKAVRKQIDELLLKAGLQKGDVVTCNGYDVSHHERNGQTSINADVLRVQLVAAGLKEAQVLQMIAEATETGDSSSWATVKPSKGSKVRR